MAGTGSLRRPLESGYRGVEYDFITAETRRDVNGNTFIAYALDTKRARTEVRAQATQPRLLRDLVATASSEPNTEAQIGRTLYNLLVPIELEAFLAGSGETQIEVDEGTAGIPWELLDDAAVTQAPRPPWAIRSKLLRKYRTETFRPQVTDADAQASILVIGEPRCPPEYPPLPGALQEAKDVFGLLTSTPGLDRDCVKDLFAGGQLQDGPDARQVVDALFERSWRVIHVAGHGEPLSRKGDPWRRGVVERHLPRRQRNQGDARRAGPRVRQLLPPGRRFAQLPAPSLAARPVRPRGVCVERRSSAHRNRRSVRRRRRLGRGRSGRERIRDHVLRRAAQRPAIHRRGG